MAETVKRRVVEIEAVPCLTACAIRLFNTLIDDNSDVFEFGSGGSSLWLAARVRSLISVEDSPEWHAVTVAKLAAQGTPTEVRLVHTAQIPDAIATEGMFDLVFVDCMTQPERHRSILTGAAHVKPDGWLVADDYNFPKVRAAVEKLRARGWAVEVVSGIKIHPLRNVPVQTSAAFCHKPAG